MYQMFSILSSSYHSLAGSKSEKMYQLLLLFGILISGVNCGYYFVTAPNIIRFDNNETVVVSVFGLNNAAVKVWLQLGDKRICERNVIVEDEKKAKHTTISVTEKDLFNTSVADEKPRTIRLFSEWNGQTQSRDIIINYKTGYLFVQTDKPIYTPLQKVKIRTLALDESLRKVNGWQVVIDIVDPSNRKLGRKKMDNSTSGFFEHQIKLPPYPEFGVWTVRAFYKGQLETEASALFEVQEYVLPTYGVEIDVDVPYILQDTESIQVTVRAKYVYGKPVDGNARLTLNLKNENAINEYIIDMTKRSLEVDDNGEGSVTEFSIDVADIINSPLLRDKNFPEGRLLEIVATVYESATGKEEATSHEGTIFATKPYIFKFTKSKKNFRPGMEYFLKVELLKANGEPAAREDIEVKMYKNGVVDQRETHTTDEYGHGVSIFQTSGDSNVIEFTAETINKHQESEKFQVEAYVGTNQIQVERVISDNKMIMRAFTNIKTAGGYTGMLFMVVTRGKIVYTKFKEAANQASEHIMEELQEIVSPDARLIVFYVDESSNELVADSIKFDVEKKCRDEGLNLATNKVEVKPGSNLKLTVTGSPYMWVGLNVMDKALLLLNNKNVLRRNKMFEALQSHDLGCGEGGGKTSADVFKKSGLTILTNADVDEDDLLRNSDECGKKRRKRDSEFCYGANQMCCDQGDEFANELIYNTDDTGSLDKYVNCYTKARDLAKKDKLPMKCIMAFFTTCYEVIDDYISDNSRITSKSLSDESSYKADLATLADVGVRLITRKDFRESWLFKLSKLDIKGQTTEFINFPNSITEWMIQGIGITPDKGMCIAEDISVNAFRDFFIQLDLPYKAVRLEHFDVKATIFNYGTPVDDNKLANIYLEGVDHLCYNSVPGNPSPKVRIELSPNSAKTVSFPMIPLRKGKFPVKVTAIVTNEGLPEIDAIEKSLYVENEGVEEKIAIHVCLDPLDQRDDCKNDDRVISDIKQGGERLYKIKMTLPEGSIPQTGSAAAYIQSNLITDVVKTIIEGVDSLFQEPAGCGEQTMVGLAPTVYAMAYLKQTKQLTDDIEIKGSQWIRNGIAHEVSQYQHLDGSYSVFQFYPSSTWLTAFVSKVFCQANKTVDDAIEENDIRKSIDWLITNRNSDGSFVDEWPVWDRSLMGQTGLTDPSLTAFVIITLQECAIRSDILTDTIEKARTFLEDIPDANLTESPYLLAITTYALALVDSPNKYRFKALLHQIQTTDEKDLYWGNPGGKPANAQSVETTAYALLAMLEFNDFKHSAMIVRWLTSQRDARGSFRSTQDTVVGLQALSQYSIATYSAEVDLNVTLLADEWNGEKFSLTKENAVVQHVIMKLPVENKNNEVTVRVSGTGSGLMTIDLRYNRPASEEESCPFEITDLEVDDIDDSKPTLDVNLANERNCDVCGKCESDPEQPDDYDIDMFDAHVEANLEIESHFGRRKRQANNGTNAKHKTTCIRFSVRSKNNRDHGMSIVNFGLETGVEIVKSDLEKLMEGNHSNIARYEMPSNGHGFVIFYLHKVSSQETNFVFRLKDEMEGDINSRQHSSVKVYDYYNPDQQCTKLYGTGPNRGESVDFECDRDKKQCQCLQSMCVKPVENEIKRIKRPVPLLFQYTCNSEKANYAVLVKIESLDYDHERNQKSARALVVKSLHQGIQPLNKDDEMFFFWNMNCDQPDLEEEKQYLIIGRDGNKFKIGDGEVYRYPLMGSALVLRDYKRGRLFKVLRRYQWLITTKGCQQ